MEKYTKLSVAPVCPIEPSALSDYSLPKRRFLLMFFLPIFAGVLKSGLNIKAFFSLVNLRDGNNMRERC